MSAAGAVRAKRRSAQRPRSRSAIYAACIGVAAIWILVDQLTKAWAVAALGGGRVIDLGVFDLRHVRNPGGAFSLPGFPGLFVGVTAIVVVVIARTLPKTTWMPQALVYGLVVGGALGNVIDRIFRVPGFPSGHVVDFIDFRWFPVFNFADIGIVTGSFLIVALTAMAERSPESPEASSDDGSAAGDGQR